MQSLKQHRRQLAILLMVAVISYSGYGFACSKASQSALDKAANASKTVATRYVETVDFVTELYKGGAIKLEMKDKIADALITFGQNGKKFNDLLKIYSLQFSNGQVPPNIWTIIAQRFDVLSADFLKIIDFLPQAAGLGNSTAFRAISAAVVALAQVLSTHSIIPDLKFRQLEREAQKYGLV
jgi:hypothetical protein